MKAFLTGSRVYGTPTKSSDIDVVVRIDEEDARKIAKRCSVAVHPQYPAASVRITKGDLDLILVTNDVEFEAWRRITNELEARKPVTKAEAKAAFQAGLPSFQRTAT